MAVARVPFSSTRAVRPRRTRIPAASTHLSTGGDKDDRPSVGGTAGQSRIGRVWLCPGRGPGWRRYSVPRRSRNKGQVSGGCCGVSSGQWRALPPSSRRPGIPNCTSGTLRVPWTGHHRGVYPRVGPSTRCVDTSSLGVIREQAHLPAEQPAPGPYPRLPLQDADPCGSRDHCPSSQQGPRAAHRLSSAPRLIARCCPTRCGCVHPRSSDSRCDVASEWRVRVSSCMHASPTARLPRWALSCRRRWATP